MSRTLLDTTTPASEDKQVCYFSVWPIKEAIKCLLLWG